jgi:peptidylprolyl isomerase domain and WD repeat-containing protein 1
MIVKISSEMGSGNISLFDPEESVQTPLNVIKIHRQPVVTMTYLPHFNMVISSDVKGMVEYWSVDLAATNEKNAAYFFPARKVKFEMKSETDLFEFAKCKTRPSSIIPSSDNEFFVCTSLDRIVRVFNTRTGRLVKSFDETLDHQSEIHRKKGLWRRARKSAENEENSEENTLESLNTEDGNLFELIPNMDDLEFGRRLALEKELEKNGHLAFESALFDEESGKFILYPTMFGIKVIRWRTGELVNIIGREEGGQRFLNVTLFQGSSSGGKRKDINEAASENPQFKQEALQSNVDPLVVCTAYKKSRFYIFSNSSPNLQERDVLNEKPEVESASGKHAKKDEAMSNLPSKAIM